MAGLAAVGQAKSMGAIVRVNMQFLSLPGYLIIHMYPLCRLTPSIKKALPYFNLCCPPPHTTRVLNLLNSSIYLVQSS